MRITHAAIISTGSEILQGLYADTNSRFLAEKLTAAGIEVVLTAAAPDDPAQLERLLRFAAGQANLVICSGGLGPTEDDVNRDVFAKVFEVSLIEDAIAIEKMTARFRNRGREMSPNNRVQALVPEGAIVFQNDWGTAPGFFLPADNNALGARPRTITSLMALPGPPRELIPMFESCALPVIRASAAGAAFVRTTTIHTFGRPESELNQCTRELFRRDDNVTFTILAKTYGVDFRVTARGRTQAEVDDLLESYRQMLRGCVGESDIYGCDAEDLASAVARKLTASGSTLTCAESCTGGLLSKMLTDISGSSAYFHQGFVTYSNEAKQRLLGVRAETLEQYGAVSAQCAAEMARGALKAAGADYALAITGIAGPTGASPGKPVGLTYIGLSSAADTFTSEHQFLGDREQNRLTAALTALNMLRLTLP